MLRAGLPDTFAEKWLYARCALTSVDEKDKGQLPIGPEFRGAPNLLQTSALALPHVGVLVDSVADVIVVGDRLAAAAGEEMAVDTSHLLRLSLQQR